MEFSKLYVYVDGSDLEDISEYLLQQLHGWENRERVGMAIVNDRYPRTPDLEPDDLPEWNLGINLDLEVISKDELKRTIQFLIGLAEVSRRDFAVGYYDAKRGISEDLLFFGFESRTRSAAEIADAVLRK